MTLERIVKDDLQMILEWRNEPNVRQNMYHKHVITSAEHAEWFEKIKKDPKSKWLIYKNRQGIPEGVVYFTEYNAVNKSAFWGLYTGQSVSRGAGARMEFEALEHAFGDMVLHKLNCEVLAGNASVVRLHKKFGFTEEGCFRDYHFDGSAFVNVFRLGILADEWGDLRYKMAERIKYHLD